MIFDWLAQNFTDLFARNSRARVTLCCDAEVEFRRENNTSDLTQYGASVVLYHLQARDRKPTQVVNHERFPDDHANGAKVCCVSASAQICAQS